MPRRKFSPGLLIGLLAGLLVVLIMTVLQKPTQNQVRSLQSQVKSVQSQLKQDEQNAPAQPDYFRTPRPYNIQNITVHLDEVKNQAAQKELHSYGNSVLQGWLDAVYGPPWQSWDVILRITPGVKTHEGQFVPDTCRPEL